MLLSKSHVERSGWENTAQAGRNAANPPPPPPHPPTVPFTGLRWWPCHKYVLLLQTALALMSYQVTVERAVKKKAHFKALFNSSNQHRLCLCVRPLGGWKKCEWQASCRKNPWGLLFPPPTPPPSPPPPPALPHPHARGENSKWPDRPLYGQVVFKNQLYIKITQGNRIHVG